MKRFQVQLVLYMDDHYLTPWTQDVNRFQNGAGQQNQQGRREETSQGK